MYDHKQCHRVEWLDKSVPVSSRFRDQFYSRENGLAEARHVFIAGNGLPMRFKDGFHVAELGFGTGLNMLAALDAWNSSGVAGTLNYTAFEAFPLSAPDLERALGGFPEVGSLSPPLLQAWERGVRTFSAGPMNVFVIEGDARESLPGWTGRADAWFLDGFSPETNPELWERQLLQCVAEKTRPNGTFATYSAAGRIRRRLEEAGFEVSRQQGFGRKRHMTVGRIRCPP